jgi:AraC-like DNA-binding protein
MSRLRQQYEAHADDAAWLEEQMMGLAREVLMLASRVRKQVNAFPAANAATRKELYQRAHLAREYILSAYAGSVSLNEIAGAVSLSPNHLLRAFRKTFGLTPHQFLTGVRLEKAWALLSSGRSVTETCAQVGFSSLGSFSHLFRRRFGFSPSALKTGEIREASRVGIL